MLNKFCKKPLYEVTKKLAAVAMGREPADLVIKNARLINVCTAEIQEDMDVCVAEGRIAAVGKSGLSGGQKPLEEAETSCNALAAETIIGTKTIGEKTVVIDAAGQYIAPGFMDGHIHVESSMISVGEYARAVVPKGTTAIFMDPHEICNVCGLAGVKAMIEDAERTPLKAISNAPSCVPAVAGFEDTGAAIGPDEVKEMLSWDGVCGLGEMMSFPNVLDSEEKIHGELKETLKADHIITGHYSVPETGAGLNAYIASGARCCHESTRAEDVLEKMRRGMFAQIRYGSAWHDLPVIIKAILDNKIDDRYACLVSDDSHTDTLLGEGHLDNILRIAIKEGLDPIKAIQYVTINTASCYRLEHEMGSIAPGKCADIVFFNDLNDIRVTRTIIDGEVVAEEGRMIAEIKPFSFPDEVYDTMHVGVVIDENSFKICVPEELKNNESVKAHVIEIIPDKVGNIEQLLDMKVKDGCIDSDLKRDILKMAVFERHHNTGAKGLGLVKGFGFSKGAVAQTVAHDAHNLLVVGTNDADMALAANTLVDCGGGICAVAEGEVLALVKLPIAGLMNDVSAEEMAGMVDRLDYAWKEMGCLINSPYMTMSLMSLACIPELRLTNKGLVDCRNFKFVDLI